MSNTVSTTGPAIITEDDLFADEESSEAEPPSR